MWLSLLIGIVCSGIIAGAAYRLRSLSWTGALAATGVGTILYVCGSVAWYGTLIVFFITSTFWSKWRKRDKQQTENAYEKSGRRDAGQVLANGGLAALLCIGYVCLPHEFWWYAFVGVMGTVTADTWATEIGSLSRKEPRSILSGRTLPRGTSGGISLLGSMAAGAGALTIGVTAWLFLQIGMELQLAKISLIWIAVISVVSGVAGAMMDSILGATIQQMRRCAVCGKEVEHHVHCDNPTLYVRGWTWMDNDAVNVASSVVGGGIAVILWMVL